jgi:aryl-alcohol dehydrogenase-like predicted oxidoreductase
MDKVTLASTGLQVSPIAFGAWQLGGEWGDFDEYEATAAVRRARELGVSLFDTAQAYGFGASERFLGRALRHELGARRDDVVIATKGGLRLARDGLVRDSSPGWLRRGVEKSLGALGIDHIDIYQVHWPDPGVPLAETAGALDELVREGKIRHVGVSNFDAEQMEEFSRTRPVETLQPPYSMLRRAVEHDALPYCLEHNVGVLAYGPLAHGLLTGGMNEDTAFAPGDWRGDSADFDGEAFQRNLGIVRELRAFAAEALDCSVAQLAIAWVLASPAVEVALVGALHPRHVEDSVAAAELELTDRDLDEIERILAGSTPVAGPSPESNRVAAAR